MGRLDVLWAYQETERELEAFEQDLRSTPARQKMNKLRGFLVEQQNALQRITSEAEARDQQVRQIAAKYDHTLAGLQEAKTDMEKGGAGSLEDAKRLRKTLEAMHNTVTGERKELYNTVAWLDKLDARLSQMRKEISKAKKEYDAVKVVCEEESEAAKERLQALKSKVDEAAKLVEPALLGRYKAIKPNHAQPLARVDGNQCGGCNMELPVVVMRKLKDPALLVECENCGRILVS